MADSSKSNGLKVAIGILAALLIGSIVFGTKLYSDQKKVSMQLEEDKQEIITDLDDIKASYEDALAESDIVNQELADATSRIELYIDSLKSSKADVAYLRRFRRQVGILKQERERLMAENDSLRSSNQLLTLQRDSTALALTEQTKYTDSLLVQNMDLSKKVEGSTVGISGLRAEGARVRSSGKIVSMSRASRVNKLRICFSLGSNTLAEVGDREMFIQVLDPNGTMMGENLSYTSEEGELSYSKKTKFYYEKNELDVCDYIDPTGDLAQGRYVVNLYDKLALVSTTTFELK